MIYILQLGKGAFHLNFTKLYVPRDPQGYRNLDIKAHHNITNQPAYFDKEFEQTNLQ